MSGFGKMVKWSRLSTSQSYISVWGVAALGNGDIAAACNDGCVRVFTKDLGRVAPAEVVAAYEEELSKVAVAAEQELGETKFDFNFDQFGLYRENLIKVGSN